ncbi:hypothetical protein A7982_12460 [Minicystis rosea]|nr:hypothetical protein A7982_12460 [Minicystis rosea]
MSKAGPRPHDVIAEPLSGGIEPTKNDATNAQGSRGRGPKGAPQKPGPTSRARAALPMATASEGMFVRAVSVRAPDVVFVKGLVEASDGLASVFAERGGELFLATTYGREAELSELLADLEVEIGARLGDAPGGMRWDTDRQDR